MHTILKIHIDYFCLNRHLFRSRGFFNKDIRYTITFWMSYKGQFQIRKGNFFFFFDLFFFHFLYIQTHLYHCFLIIGNSTIYTEIQRTWGRSDIKSGPRAIILRWVHCWYVSLWHYVFPTKKWDQKLAHLSAIAMGLDLFNIEHFSC